MKRAVVIDDEAGIVYALEKFLKQEGFRVRSAATAEDGIELVLKEKPDIVFLDLKLPGKDGLSMLETLSKSGVSTRVVMITAHGTLESAVRAKTLGAVETIVKPIDLERVRAAIRRALEPPAASPAMESLRPENRRKFWAGGFVGVSPAMQAIFDRIAQVCATGSNVLISGESGTGKELVARALHDNSPRAQAPFETINCAAIPEHLLESELFGHERGAFTGAMAQRRGRLEIADGGTVFMDEVSELPAACQSKILRFAETRQVERLGGSGKIEVNVRIVSATNQDLDARVRAGKFREDLFYRLNVVRIDVPPLRERREDIDALVAFFLEKFGARGISDDAVELIRRGRWRGNVRELRNAIERASVLAGAGVIAVEHVSEAMSSDPGAAADLAAVVTDMASCAGAGTIHAYVFAQVERELIRRALQVNGGNQVKASEWLGINRGTLRAKIQEYGI